MVTEEKIKENYDKFMEYVKADSRAEKLMVMYEDFGNTLIEAPAAGKVHYHNAFPGGYIDHVLRVVEATLQMSALYKKIGGNIDFTKEEAVFAALHHDLGKLGDPMEGPYYLDQDSDWHRKRGELYKHNDNLSYMTPPDRALMLLQRYDIKITNKEWIGIKLSDGLYDDGNKSYLKTYQPYPLRTVLPRIIHTADYLSSQAENDNSRF
jgi:hypothetical protein